MTARASSSDFERSCNSKLFQSWWSCQYRRLRCSADLAARGAAPFVLMKFNQWRQRLKFTVPSCTPREPTCWKERECIEVMLYLFTCTCSSARDNARTHNAIPLLKKTRFSKKALAVTILKNPIWLWVLGWEHKCMSKEDLRMKQIYTGSPSVSLKCFVESGELERCLRYSDLKKVHCQCL